MAEKELVQKILQGDKKLFNELILTFKKKVLNVCYSILKNKEDAEDVSQEVFIEVFRSLAKFKWKSSLSTWVIRIAVTRSLNLIKKRSSKKWLGSLSGIFSVSEEGSKEIPNLSTRTPFENITNEETKEALTNALNSLPDPQRIVYSLSKVEDMSNKEICEVMKLSTSAVESLIFRARKNLQKALSDFYEKNFK